MRTSGARGSRCRTDRARRAFWRPPPTSTRRELIEAAAPDPYGPEREADPVRGGGRHPRPDRSPGETGRGAAAHGVRGPLRVGFHPLVGPARGEPGTPSPAVHHARPDGAL